MRHLLCIPVALAAACATPTEPNPTPEVRYETVEKKVPVPIACVPDDIGPAPEYPDSKTALLSAESPAERYRLVIQGRSERAARLADIEPILRACMETPDVQ